MLRPIENFGVIEFGNMLADDELYDWPDCNLIDSFEDDEPITREIAIITQPRAYQASKPQWVRIPSANGMWMEVNRLGSIMVYVPDVRMAIWNANRYAFFLE